MNPESARGDSGPQNVDDSFWAALFAEEEANPASAEPLDKLTLEDESILTATDQSENLSISRQIDPWTMAQDAYEDEETLTLTVTGFNKGGLLVEWHNLPGFVPASQLVDFPNSTSPHNALKSCKKPLAQPCKSKSLKSIHA